MRDVHAQVLLRVAERAAPDDIEQLAVRQRAPSLGGQGREELPLDAGEANRVTIARDAMTGEIDPQAHRLDRIESRAAGHRRGAAQLNVYACVEFAQAERLRDIVVAPASRSFTFSSSE